MNAVEELFALFGGIRKCQRKLGERHASTLQAWQAAGKIPHYRRAQVRAAASQHRIKIPPDLWERIFPTAEAA